MKKEWKNLTKYLPAGWEEKARELGALQRSRAIKSADDLLTLNLLYLTQGGSFQASSTMMKMAANISINKNATRKRVQNSWKWLQWLAQNVCQKYEFAIAKPKWLGERNVILIDASDEALKGSKTSDYRLHYEFDLFNFTTRTMEITTIKEGEKLSRYEFKEQDIVVADRIYCTMSGVEHAAKQGGGFVIRFKSKAFKLYDEKGKGLELLPLFRELSEFESRDVSCFYKLSTGELRPIRIVAMKKDAKAIEGSRRKMARTASKKQEKPVQQDTAELNEYIVLATNLADTNEQILELYRARWQIEQVFFRLKSLFGYGDAPGTNPNSVKAWFYGKLLVAALCEAIIKAESFSPEEEKLFFGTAYKKHME